MLDAGSSILDTDGLKHGQTNIADTEPLSLNPLPFERGEGDYLWRTSENSKQESGRPYLGYLSGAPPVLRLGGPDNVFRNSVMVVDISNPVEIVLAT